MASAVAIHGRLVLLSGIGLCAIKLHINHRTLSYPCAPFYTALLKSLCNVSNKPRPIIFVKVSNYRNSSWILSSFTCVTSVLKCCIVDISTA